MQQNFVKRSKMIKAMRDYLDSQEFLDVETPVLTKSTPEGARDYLVPSRTHENKFFALPQSPQLFKQLLMVSGFDRYYQVVKCFRDEDLRPNRQPEFTQLDLEASFIDETFIYDLIEGLMVDVAAVCDIKLPTPFPRLTYDEAMNRYGSDAPDLRFDMPLCDVTDILPDSGYKIFNTIVKNGGLIKGMRIPGQAAALSKNVLQNEFAMSLIQKMGGKGMTWMKLENGEFLSNIVQFFTQDELNQIKDRLSAEDGDVLVFVADTDHHLVNTVLGKFRVFIADRQGLIPENTYAPCWVTNFPLFDPHESGVTSTHHPVQDNVIGA
jgi:aspartyl-tRNA synthetase